MKRATQVVQLTSADIYFYSPCWQAPPEIDVSTPPINGLTDISLYLGHLDYELQSPFTDLLGQIQADVSSLDRRVRSLALMLDCPIQGQPSVEPREPLFPDSQHYLTLAKVQHYLQNLPSNKEKLKVCWQMHMYNINAIHCNEFNIIVALCFYPWKCFFCL